MGLFRPPKTPVPPVKVRLCRLSRQRSSKEVRFFPYNSTISMCKGGGRSETCLSIGVELYCTSQRESLEEIYSCRID